MDAPGASRVPGAVPFDPGAIPDDVARTLWRSLTRHGHDVTMEDARMFAALVKAALGNAKRS